MSSLSLLDDDGEEFFLCRECCNALYFSGMSSTDGLDIDYAAMGFDLEDIEPLTEFECARCGRFKLAEVPEEDEPEHEDSEPPMCSSCNGTGMPRFGPPDVGRCSSCGGSGVERSRDDDYFEEPDDYIPDDAWQGAQDRYDRMIYGP